MNYKIRLKLKEKLSTPFVFRTRRKLELTLIKDNQETFSPEAQSNVLIEVEITRNGEPKVQDWSSITWEGIFILLPRFEISTKTCSEIANKCWDVKRVRLRYSNYTGTKWKRSAIFRNDICIPNRRSDDKIWITN